MGSTVHREHAIDLVSPSHVLVNGRSYAIPEGCRFLAFRLADGVPVDFDTKRPLPEDRPEYSYGPPEWRPEEGRTVPAWVTMAGKPEGT